MIFQNPIIYINKYNWNPHINVFTVDIFIYKGQ
jgi:hypothetical protein